MRRVAVRTFLGAAAWISVVVGAEAGSRVASPPDGPTPAAALERLFAGIAVGLLIAAAIPLAERLLWPTIGGFRWRAVFLGGIAVGLTVAAVGVPSWANPRHDATICARDGVTGRIACSDHQRNVGAAQRAFAEYLGGGLVVGGLTAAVALRMRRRTDSEPTRRLATNTT
jgi:hypothetical protein